MAINSDEIKQNIATLKDFANNFLTVEKIKQNPEVVLSLIGNLVSLIDISAQMAEEKQKEVVNLRLKYELKHENF